MLKRELEEKIKKIEKEFKEKLERSTKREEEAIILNIKMGKTIEDLKEDVKEDVEFSRGTLKELNSKLFHAGESLGNKVKENQQLDEDFEDYKEMFPESKFKIMEFDMNRQERKIVSLINEVDLLNRAIVDQSILFSRKGFK